MAGALAHPKICAFEAHLEAKAAQSDARLGLYLAFGPNGSSSEAVGHFVGDDADLKELIQAATAAQEAALDSEKWAVEGNYQEARGAWAETAQHATRAACALKRLQAKAKERVLDLSRDPSGWQVAGPRQTAGDYPIAPPLTADDEQSGDVVKLLSGAQLEQFEIAKLIRRLRQSHRGPCPFCGCVLCQQIPMARPKIRRGGA